MNENVKTQTVKARVTPEEKIKLEQLAQQENMSVSAYLLNKSLYHVPVDPRYNRIMYSILNQIDILYKNFSNSCTDEKSKQILKELNKEVLNLWQYVNM